MLSLFGETGIVHDPGNHRTILHRGKYLLSNLAEHLFIAPRSIGHQMMQRLVHAANIVRGQACSHRFNALPLARQ